MNQIVNFKMIEIRCVQYSCAEVSLFESLSDRTEPEAIRFGAAFGWTFSIAFGDLILSPVQFKHQDSFIKFERK